LDGLTGPLTREAAAQWRESHQQLQTRYGRLDKRTEDNLLTLQPLAALKVRQMMTALRGLADWKLICGIRTYEEQDRLYGKRPRVTRAKGGQSMHNFGIAGDVCLFVDGKDVWTPSEGANSIYKPVAALAHKLGLVWGGDFKSIYDPGHVQLGELSTATLHHAYTTGSATLAQLLQS
ncbi:M15 family metallopeptidase, partial [Faecalibaculum rodentium]|uniref:M15 family metallopeptidase n=1 Tax=Faecalibaculum rodentium TaxID=1702221 RepID=UPI0025A99F74